MIENIPGSVAICREIILDDGEVCHGRVCHGRVSGVFVFRDDNVPSPCRRFFEQVTLRITYELVDREGHAVAGNRRKKYNKWCTELLRHAIE